MPSRSYLVVPLLMILALASAIFGFGRLVWADENHEAKMRLFLVGDSTVAEHDEGTSRGWGQYLHEFCPPSVKIYNCATGGRSSKSFQAEGHWKKVLARRPDVVLIQFGHNDALNKFPEIATAADGEYRECLIRYVKTAREVGAVPIFVTPVHCRTFAANGELRDGLKAYAEMMKKIAEKWQVPLIDLHELSGQLFVRLGRDGSEHFANEPGDTVHFNEVGARAMTMIVAEQLRQIEPRLVLARSVRLQAEAGK